MGGNSRQQQQQQQHDRNSSRRNSDLESATRKLKEAYHEFRKCID